MNDHDRTILVPVSQKRTPYRIDPVDNPHCLRIRLPGPDVLILVPPGADPTEHRDFVSSAMRASAHSSVTDRSKDGALAALLVLLPALLMVGLIASLDASGEIFVGLSGFMQAFFVIGFMLYIGVVLAPRHGVIATLFSVEYPSRPESILRRAADEAGIRFLAEGELSRPGMEVLHRAILRDPTTVPEQVWATLWVLADRPDLYPSALDRLRDQAEDFEHERIALTQFDFRNAHQVILEDLEAAEDADEQPDEDLDLDQDFEDFSDLIPEPEPVAS